MRTILAEAAWLSNLRLFSVLSVQIITRQDWTFSKVKLYSEEKKNVDLLTSCQCLTICKKLVFYLLKVYTFPKIYFYLWNILKKWHWFWPPPPLLKCHFYSHIQNLIFFWDPPPFLHNVILFTDFFFEVFPN